MMHTYYYIVDGEMTLVDCSPEWDGNVRNEDYTWLIKKVYEATGHRIKRRDCGFVSKVNDMRAKEREEPEEEEDMQPFYEVYVENILGQNKYFGPYSSYEECVEFINETYSEKTINDPDFMIEIQEQEPNGQGSYYAYPDRAIKPGD